MRTISLIGPQPAIYRSVVRKTSCMSFDFMVQYGLHIKIVKNHDAAGAGGAGVIPGKKTTRTEHCGMFPQDSSAQKVKTLVEKPLVCADQNV